MQPIILPILELSHPSLLEHYFYKGYHIISSRAVLMKCPVSLYKKVSWKILELADYIKEDKYLGWHAVNYQFPSSTWLFCLDYEHISLGSQIWDLKHSGKSLKELAFLPVKSATQMKTPSHRGVPVFLKRPVPGSAADFQGCLVLASST